MNETTVILKVLETTGPCPPTWDTLMLVIGVIEEYPDIAGISGGGTVGSNGTPSKRFVRKKTWTQK